MLRFVLDHHGRVPAGGGLPVDAPIFVVRAVISQTLELCSGAPRTCGSESEFLEMTPAREGVVLRERQKVRIDPGTVVEAVCALAPDQSKHTEIPRGHRSQREIAPLYGGNPVGQRP
jgi:hypothetical protein